MGWRLRSIGTANGSSSGTPNRPLSPSTSLMNLSQSYMEYSELEARPNNTDVQVPRRRRCGIQHGVSGRSNSIAHSPFFTTDSLNRLQIASFPS